MYLKKTEKDKLWLPDVDCPKCGEWIRVEDDFEDSEDGEYDICPYCKTPLKLTFYYTRVYSSEVCSKEEFEEETGEELEEWLSQCE